MTNMTVQTCLCRGAFEVDVGRFSHTQSSRRGHAEDHFDMLSLLQSMTAVRAAYLQAEVLWYNAYHKTAKLRFDDGYDETVSLRKERIRLLTPRAASAGCSAAMAALLTDLGAVGAWYLRCSTHASLARPRTKHPEHAPRIRAGSYGGSTCNRLSVSCLFSVSAAYWAQYSSLFVNHLIRALS